MDIRSRLKIMLFLQYFIWGCWLVTFASYAMNTLKFSGTEVGFLFSTKGIAAVIMPSLVGIIADKWIRANRLYMFCHLIGAMALLYMSTITNSTLMFWAMLINAMAYMPTIALSNTISYYSLDKNKLDSLTHFPKVRVYGTIGFIAAMWLISLLGFEENKAQLYVACGASLLLVFYSTLLPSVVAENKKQNLSWTSKLGLDAFVLFKRPQLAIFFVFATLLGAVLQVTNTFGSPFLRDLAANPLYHDNLVARYPSILLSVSQMAEVLCILAITFFLRKYGIKKIILISMIAWSLRFALFAFGDFSYIGIGMLLMSMIVYGCAFDFFNVSGSMYIEKEVGPEIRASAQGLFMTMVNGIGAYMGSIISGIVIDHYTVDGVKDWPAIWLVFAAYAAVLAVAFYFLFQYEHKPDEEVNYAH